MRENCDRGRQQLTNYAAEVVDAHAVLGSAVSMAVVACVARAV